MTKQNKIKFKSTTATHLHLPLMNLLNLYLLNLHIMKNLNELYVIYKHLRDQSSVVIII